MPATRQRGGESDRLEGAAPVARALSHPDGAGKKQTTGRDGRRARTLGLHLGAWDDGGSRGGARSARRCVAHTTNRARHDSGGRAADEPENPRGLLCGRPSSRIRALSPRAEGPAHVAHRHARAQRLQRGHLSGAHRRRRRCDGDRRGQWRRRSDAQAVRGLSAPPATDPHLRQQVRPTVERPAGTARRCRADARDCRGPDELADRECRTLSWCLRPAEPDAPSLRAGSAGTVPGTGRSLVTGRPRRARNDRRYRVRALPRVAGPGPRSGHVLRPRGVSGWSANPLVLRQRADELRHRAVPPGACRLRTAAPTSSERYGRGERDRRAFHRVRVQDSGEHGPGSSRSCRVRPRLLGAFHEGHDAVQSPPGEVTHGLARVPVLWPRPQNDQGRLRGRHHRPRESWTLPDRRHPPFRPDATVCRLAAIPGRALWSHSTEGHTLQAVRRGSEAARRRRADAGLLPKTIRLHISEKSIGASGPPGLEARSGPARVRVRPRRPAPLPRVPRSLAGPYSGPRRDMRRTDRRCPAPAARLAGVRRALTRWCVARGEGAGRCAGWQGRPGGAAGGLVPPAPVARDTRRVGRRRRAVPARG